MGVGDWAKEVLGNVEKAVLVFYDKRNVKTTAAAASKTSFASNMAGNALAKVASVPGQNGVTERHYTVQFNPNSISFYCYGKSGTYLPIGSVIGNTPTQDVESKSLAKLELDMMLMFDRVNVYDAFMLEKFTNTSLSSIVNGVTAAVAVTNNGGFSVRKEMDGLLAAARNPKLNTVKFCWRNFIYEGVITSAQANYTMFNPEGEPIRGEMRLKITQKVDNALTLKRWQDQFEAAFGGAGFGAADAGQATSKLGNFLNFTL